MGESVDGCLAKGIDFLVSMVVKGAIGNEDYTLVIAFCLVASYHVGIVPGDTVTCLDGCLAAIQQLYLAAFIHYKGGGGIMENDVRLTEDVYLSGGVEVDFLVCIAYEDGTGGRIFIIEDSTQVNICLELRIYGFEGIDYLLRYLDD